MSVDWRAPPELADAIVSSGDPTITMKHFAVAAMALAAAAATSSARRILAQRRLDTARLAPVRAASQPCANDGRMRERIAALREDAERLRDAEEGRA